MASAALWLYAEESLFLIEQCRSVYGRSGIAFSRVKPPSPPLHAKGCFLSNQHAIIDERCYFLYTKLISAGTIFLLCQWLLSKKEIVKENDTL